MLLASRLELVNNMPGDPFDICLPTDPPLRRAALAAARPLLRVVFGLHTCSALYQLATANAAGRDGGRATPRDAQPFAARALQALDVRSDWQISPGIPERGPLLIVSNHPHGVLDGLLLLEGLGRVRADVRLLANFWLARVPELRDVCFFVDPFERRGAAARSLPGLRAAHRWLRRGGALIVFPSGEVAHDRTAEGVVLDAPWRLSAAGLALATAAPVLPVHIERGNSRLFTAVGRLHPALRTALLPRELLKAGGRTVRVKTGTLLRESHLTAFGNSSEEATRVIRVAVDHLASAGPIADHGRKLEPTAAIAAAAAADRIANEIGRLPASALLVDDGHLQVYCAEADRVPATLDEIGRLREIAFRAVGEGTGLPRDLDRFDEQYVHLFLWHPERREVVGAYRMGLTDRLIEASGVGGLYTRTLFRYDRRLLERLPPALELGRSFVRLEYQRNHAALLLLWRGICAFVSRHPRYRVLLGAVSISARYHDRTRDLLVRFLEQNHRHDELAALVSACNPHSPRLPRCSLDAAVPRTVQETDRRVAALEGAGRGMPVLLRQYLKLNARVLAFNIDPAFGDALDALMMVDLTEVDRRILDRYFGSADAQSFLAFHAVRSVPTPREHEWYDGLQSAKRLTPRLAGAEAPAHITCSAFVFRVTRAVRSTWRRASALRHGESAGLSSPRPRTQAPL